MLTYLANAAYILMLIAFVTRDVLYLRGLLVIAQSVVVAYTWYNGVHMISAWNGLFAAINAFMLGCDVSPAIGASATSTMCTPHSIAAM